MYEAHFGLEGLPFHIAPDLHFYVDTAAHRAAVEALQAGLARGDEFIALTGDFGSGKTMIARRLIQLVDRDRFAVGELAGWGIERDDLLTRIAVAFGVRDFDADLPLGALMTCLQEIAHGGRAALLVIDEAHLLGLDAVRRLAKLTAVSVDGRAVLRVCLVGRTISPAIDEHASVGRPLQIGTQVQLEPLDAAAVDAYIRGRLERVGWKGRPSFAAGATAEIQARCAGNPSRINRLCGHILEQLWEFGADLVTVELVRLVAARLESELGEESDDSMADADPDEQALSWQAEEEVQAASPFVAAPTAAAAQREPPIAMAPPATSPRRGVVAADALVDIELMPEESVPERLPALAGKSDRALATTNLHWASWGSSRWTAKRRLGLQAAVLLLAFGGGFVAWRGGGLSNVAGGGPGRIATSGDKPPAAVAAVALNSPAPVAALAASKATRVDESALSLELAPTAAGKPVISTSPEQPATTPAAATASAAVAPPPLALAPPAVAVAERPRPRPSTRVAGNGAGSARMSAATAACSLEAQAMGLCRRAQRQEPVRQAAPDPVRPAPPPPPPPPPPRPACEAARAALGLCGP